MMRVRRVPDGGKAGDPLGERRHKTGILHERRGQLEQLDLVAGVGVDATGTAVQTRRRLSGQQAQRRLRALDSFVQRAFQTRLAGPWVC